MTAPYQPTAKGLRLAVRVSPGARKDEIQGLVKDAAGKPLLGIRIAAPPVDGEANRALVRFLARTLGARQADLSVAAGASSRNKMIEIAGDPQGLAERIAKFCG